MSLAANNRDKAVDVCCGAKSVSIGTVVEGSSLSFSGIGNVRRLRGKGPDAIGDGSFTLTVPRRVVLPLEADKEAKGLELLDGIAELRDAWAVFADTDAVGGPEEKIDRGGGSKKVA